MYWAIPSTLNDNVREVLVVAPKNIPESLSRPHFLYRTILPVTNINEKCLLLSFFLTFHSFKTPHQLGLLAFASVTRTTAFNSCTLATGSVTPSCPQIEIR
jgi:hypothetical protein